MTAARLGSPAGCRGGGGKIATAGRIRRCSDPSRPPGEREVTGPRADGSAGAPNPGTSWEARSEVKEATRDRKARSGRRPTAREGRSPRCNCGTAGQLAGSDPGRSTPWPPLREAHVVRTWRPPSHRRNMRRGREAREKVAMANGHRERRPREDGPNARPAGAEQGTTRHPGAPPVANSGAHPVANSSSGGASTLVPAAQMACAMAG